MDWVLWVGYVEIILNLPCIFDCNGWEEVALGALGGNVEGKQAGLVISNVAMPLHAFS